MLKISVITPSYNQAQFLDRTFRSVYDQNYPNLEHIVIDGGSKDGSVEIIKKYADRLAYWVSEKDRGQTDALNKGFVRCTGDILCWLNSDDTFLPGTLHKVAATAEKYPDFNFFFGDVQFTDADDKVIGIKRFAPIKPVNVLMEGMVFSQPATFWRKSLMDQVGLLDVNCRFSMDYDLFCRMAPMARYKYLDGYLATYRMHEASKTCTIGEVGAAESRVMRTKYCDPVYPQWKQRLMIPIFKAERVLYHLSHLRFHYLMRAMQIRMSPGNFH